mgnify:CR=1 FL=1
MMRWRASHAKLALSALGLTVLTGCASVSLDQNTSRVNDEAGSFAGGQLALATTQDERDQRAQATHTLLAQPLGKTQAVQLALVNSPSLQVLLAFDSTAPGCAALLPSSQSAVPLGRP